jgi:hypothetical protein
MLIFNYIRYYADILPADFLTDLHNFFYSEVHFHRHADCLFSPAIKLLCLIRTIALSFSSRDIC